MSYLVLARKYRPRRFTEMVGQEHVVQALGNALSTQRLHHAYLFTGTRGVGKTTVSRILAKSLNCVGLDGQGGITAEPCGQCQPCRDIDSGRFVDYTELDAASNRGVDEVQTLLEQAVYKPVQGRFKVFMIDEVHMLTNTAFNAMLKTLEEPPEYLKFVLATTDPQKVPVTVLSRCLQFNLRPMAPQTVAEHLQRVLDAEGVAWEASCLTLLSRAARGSMRDALSLTDQAIAFGAGALVEASVRQMLGSVDRSYVFTLLQALGAGDGAAVVATCEQLRLHGLNAASTLDDMTTVLQRVAVLQAVGEAALDSSDPDSQALAALAQALPATAAQLLYSLCLHGRAELGLAPDEYAALTMVLLRFLVFHTPGAEKKTPYDAAAGVMPRAAAPRAALTPAASVALPVPQARLAAERPGVALPQSAPTPVPASASAWAPASVAVDTADTASTVPVAAPLAASAHAPAPLRPAASASPTAATAPAVTPHPAPGPAAAVVQPWEDLPQGRVLPVVDPDAVAAEGPANTEPKRHPARVEQAHDATKIVAIPVRPVSQRAEAVRDEPLRPTDEGDFWFDTVQALIASESITALARELALQAQLVARDTDQWLLRVERESLNQSGARERLTTALQGAGHAVRLAIEMGRVSDNPARRIRAAQEARQLGAEKIVESDPLVQGLMQRFGAKIVPASIKPL